MVKPQARAAFSPEGSAGGGGLHASPSLVVAKPWSCATCGGERVKEKEWAAHRSSLLARGKLLDRTAMGQRHRRPARLGPSHSPLHSKWPEVLYLVTGLENKYTKQERGLEVVGRLRHFVSGD